MSKKKLTVALVLLLPAMMMIDFSIIYMGEIIPYIFQLIVDYWQNVRVASIIIILVAYVAVILLFFYYMKNKRKDQK